MDFQIPKIVHEEVDENRGVFQIEPLDRGFGYTFGNSLRRVLLSSLESRKGQSVPEWLELNANALSGRVLNIPSRQSVQVPINEQLIVELYSK